MTRDHNTKSCHCTPYKLSCVFFMYVLNCVVLTYYHLILVTSPFYHATIYFSHQNASTFVERMLDHLVNAKASIICLSMTDYMLTCGKNHLSLVTNEQFSVIHFSSLSIKRESEDIKACAFHFLKH